jgi:hypothetical protein
LQARQASAVVGTFPVATAAGRGSAGWGIDRSGERGDGLAAQPPRAITATSATRKTDPTDIGYDAEMTLYANRILASLGILVLAACGSGNGGSDAGNHGGAGGGGGAGGRAAGGSGGGRAAGGSGGAAGDSTSSFVGSWTFDTGSVTPTCTGVTPPAISLIGNAVTITKIDASHVNFSFSNSELVCKVAFTVSGTTATAESGQTCTITVMGISGTFDVTSWTLMDSGNTLSMSVKGTAKVATVSCNPVGSGMLSRVDASAG